MNIGLPNLWIHLTELFWELCSVMSVEEVLNRNCFGINSVILVCVQRYNRRVPPCVVQTCAVRPILARVLGNLWTATSSKCPRSYEAHATSGAQSGAPRRSWTLVHQQHLGPESQDSQRMLNPPWRAFPDLSAPKSQRFLRFAIAMPITDPRNRAISKTRESNDALRFKGAMESR